MIPEADPDNLNFPCWASLGYRLTVGEYVRCIAIAEHDDFKISLCGNESHTCFRRPSATMPKCPECRRVARQIGMDIMGKELAEKDAVESNAIFESSGSQTRMVVEEAKWDGDKSYPCSKCGKEDVEVCDSGFCRVCCSGFHTIPKLGLAAQKKEEANRGCKA